MELETPHVRTLPRILLTMIEIRTAGIWTNFWARTLILQERATLAISCAGVVKALKFSRKEKSGGTQCKAFGGTMQDLRTKKNPPC